jgi:copper chaperone CopZ
MNSKTKRYIVGNMTCAACVKTVEDVSLKVDGIEKANVSLLSNSLEIIYNDNFNEERLKKVIKKSGYKLKVNKDLKDNNYQEEKIKDLKTRFIISLIFLIPLMYISMGEMLKIPLPSIIAGSGNLLTRSILMLLFTIIIVFINRIYFINGIKALLDHIAFKNTSSTSYDRGLYLNTSINPTTYSWATVYSKIVANNCTFDNVRVDIYGGSGAQHVDVKFDGCTFTNNTASSYSAFAENYYIYGDVEFEDCSFDIRLSATSRYAVELGNNSSNGNNPVNLIVKDTEIVVRSNSYASHNPISGISATSTIFTVTESGTNSYKVVNNSNDTQFRMTDVYGTTLGE